MDPATLQAQTGEWVKPMIGIAGSWLVAAVVAYRKSAKQEGKDEVKEAQVRKDISDLKHTVLQSEKELADKVSLSLFKEEITEIHGRISRMQSEQAAALKDQGLKIDKLLGKVEFLSGKIQMWATMKGLPGGSDDHE